MSSTAAPAGASFNTTRAATVAAGVVAVVLGVALLRDPSYSRDDRSALGEAWRESVRSVVVNDDIATPAIASIHASVAGPRGTRADGLRVVRKAGGHAFVVVDGTVALSVDLLGALHSEAELAAVIAHAQAHLDLGHIDRMLVGLQDRRGDVRDGLSSSGDLAIALGVAAVADTTTFAPADEIAADEATFVALRRGGWSPLALRAAMQSIADSDDAAVKSWLSHHPLVDERMAAWGPREREQDGATTSAGARVNETEYATRVIERLFPDRKARAVQPTTTTKPDAPSPTPWPARTFEPAPG